MYQLHHLVNYLGDMYGFTMSVSGYQIIYSCGQSHKRKRLKNSNYLDKMASSKKRIWHAVSDLMCPMHINASSVIHPFKGDRITRAEWPVKVTMMSLEHNNDLNKRILIQAKKSTHKYCITFDVAKKLLKWWTPDPFQLKHSITFSSLTSHTHLTFPARCWQT